jgi:hypothetical protein
MMDKKNEFIELRSNEVQEILTRVPPGIIRWGITVIFLILCLLFFGSWMIHYPDIVGGTFKLTSLNDTDYIGELTIPEQNFGKVQVGQTVLIKFAAYPYQEFGAVRGVISEITEAPFAKGMFQAKVTFSKVVTSTYGTKLTYKSGMTATAEVITEDKRLLEKIFFQLRSIMDGKGS